MFFLHVSPICRAEVRRRRIMHHGVAPHIQLSKSLSFCFLPPMSKASLSAIVRYCDQTLRTDKVEDFEGAVNGLQVENRGRVTRIAAAVDRKSTRLNSSHE